MPGVIQSFITHKLKSPLALRYDITKMDEDQEQKKVLHFQRLYDFYVNDQRKIKEYTLQNMRVLFDKDTLDSMLLPYLNIVRRIIKRTSLAYKLPPERYINVPVGVKEGELVRAHENYQLLLESSNINSRSKEWNAIAKLCDTVYVQPIWREDRLEYDVFAPHQIRVIPRAENYLEPEQVEYEILGGDGKVRRVFWSKDEHWIWNEEGRPIEGENDWNGVNKYGVLPLLPCRLKETDTKNHWGEGDTQLVDINEKINVLLASLNYNALMQSHGQPVAINIDIKGDIAIGPNKPIIGRQVPGDAAPSFSFAQPNPAIAENITYIDWLVKQAAMTHGLPASAVSIEVDPQSGAAKAIDNWELLEVREDDLEYLRPFEKRLFDISRTVWNWHQPARFNISPKATFGIDFVAPESPISEKEELENKKVKMDLGLWAPHLDFIDEDEGIDKEAAIGLVRENLEVRNELKDEFGLGAILNGTSTDDEPSDSEGQERDKAFNGRNPRGGDKVKD